MPGRVPTNALPGVQLPLLAATSLAKQLDCVPKRYEPGYSEHRPRCFGRCLRQDPCRACRSHWQIGSRIAKCTLATCNLVGSACGKGGSVWPSPHSRFSWRLSGATPKTSKPTLQDLPVSWKPFDTRVGIQRAHSLRREFHPRPGGRWV